MAPRWFRDLERLRDAALGTAGALVDRAAVDLALELGRARTPQGPETTPEEQLRVLARVAEAYDPGLWGTGVSEGFFADPWAATVTAVPVGKAPGGGTVVDLVGDSGYVPVHPVAREAYLAEGPNRQAHARAWLHPEPRATVLCVHGYLGGHMAFEEVAFGVAGLYARGLDVVVAVLPFHGPRTPPAGRGSFPGRDPWRTVEGFGQAVWDLRRWRGWLHARGASRVVLFGMSLGAYTSALAATVDTGWDGLVAMVPLASLADAYFDHRAGTEVAPPAWVRPRIEDAFRVVSPFTRIPRVRPESVLVLAASGDQITPRAHAERIAAHFRAGPVASFAGGHLLQAGRATAFARLGQYLEARGLVAPR